eukprot:TRINITY_DN302_c1_g1_i1.p1 TRINITY_DN302_c1_g1~~TRINITY_DN302_c1_g1_i1.p1  ORF type:complete len:835 (+),score=319.30 TRINITY_DN302_c1_g1_i1:90-2507(+)
MDTKRIGTMCGGAAAAYCVLQAVLQVAKRKELARNNPGLSIDEDGQIQGKQASVIIRTVVSPILLTIDMILWLLSAGPLRMLSALAARRGARAVPVRTFRDERGEAAVWRAPNAAKGLMKSIDRNVHTLWELCAAAHARYPDRQSLGVRPLKCTYRAGSPERPGSKTDTRVYGKTEWYTFADVGKKARMFGAGLVGKLGMRGLTGVGGGEAFDKAQGPFVMLIWEDTCAEWMLAVQGAFSQALTVATAYATLGEDAVIDAVNEGSVSVLLCNIKHADALAKRKGEMKTLKHIIYTRHLVPSDAPIAEPTSPMAVSFEKVLQDGQALISSHPPKPPQPCDVAVLMYTSGSTGKPKGVKVSHGQLLSAVAAVGERISPVTTPGEDVGVGYLPLAHIFEMALEFYHFGNSNRIGYADPFSLMTQGSKLASEPCGALDEFRPTLLAGVPKIWELVKAGVCKKVAAGNPTRAHLFSVAMTAKLAAVQCGASTPFLDKLIFAKTKAALGGRCKLCVSGGGALSPSVQAFLRCVLCCNLIQGYGLTETCAGATVQNPSSMLSGDVGPPIGACEILLHSEPEITDEDAKPYLSTDTNHLGEPCRGRGEVWIRGNSVTSGYYKMPEKTWEDFWPEGTAEEQQYFKTGDIAIFTPEGTLRIVDRKKNLAKLRGGEYIRTEQMNQAFNTCPYVNAEQGSCAYGDGDMDRPVALIQPNWKAIEDWAEASGVQYDKQNTKASLAGNKQVRAEVLRALNDCGKKQGLSPIEKIVGVALLQDDWTTANGCLTATLKIIPNGIVKRFNKKQVDELKRETAR